MPVLKKAVHERFAQVFAVNGNASEAYRIATGKAASHNARFHAERWTTKDHILKRIAEIMDEAAAKCSKTKEDMLDWHCRVMDGKLKATLSQQKSAEAISRMCGYNAPEKTELSGDDSLQRFLESIVK